MLYSAIVVGIGPLERPFAFGFQLSNPGGVALVKPTPYGVLPGEVDRTAVGFCLFRVLHEGFGGLPCQNRDCANW